MKECAEMKNNEIEKRISDGFREMTPAYSEDLWKQPVNKAKGNEWYLSTEEQRKTPKLILRTAMAMACVMIFSFGYWFTQARTFASVYMDVNPSITFRINAREKVTEVIAENADAEMILQDMDLKNTDIDVAVNAVLGSLIRNGYLDEVHHILLLSMECDNREKGNVIRERLLSQINESLMTWFGKATVLDQEVSSDDELEELAKENDISVGKAAVIARAVRENSALDPEELARMSMKDLMVRLHREGTDIDDYFDDMDDYYEFIREADEDDIEDIIDDLDDEDEDDRDDDSADHDEKKQPASVPSPKPSSSPKSGTEKEKSEDHDDDREDNDDDDDQDDDDDDDRDDD